LGHQLFDHNLFIAVSNPCPDHAVQSPHKLCAGPLSLQSNGTNRLLPPTAAERALWIAKRVRESAENKFVSAKSEIVSAEREI
jgi:hypothetical protein